MVDKDMIAVRISPDLHMAIVGLLDYFSERRKPKSSKDLTEHNCLNPRPSSHAGLYAWEFEKAGSALNAHGAWTDS